MLYLKQFKIFKEKILGINGLGYADIIDYKDMKKEEEIEQCVSLSGIIKIYFK